MTETRRHYLNSASVIAGRAIADVFLGTTKKAAASKMDHSPNRFMVFLFAVFLLAVPAGSTAGDKYQEMINCSLHKGSCNQFLSETRVTLEVTPRPVKAMQDLLFQVTFSEKLLSKTKLPYIDLDMPGMKMGPNRVQLKSAGNDTYQGQGVIVRCPSGRRTWRATVTIPGFGQTDFIFDVIY